MSAPETDLPIRLQDLCRSIRGCPRFRDAATSETMNPVEACSYAATPLACFTAISRSFTVKGDSLELVIRRFCVARVMAT